MQKLTVFISIKRMYELKKILRAIGGCLGW
jgi:hypothetical protein